MGRRAGPLGLGHPGRRLDPPRHPPPQARAHRSQRHLPLRPVHLRQRVQEDPVSLSAWFVVVRLGLGIGGDGAAIVYLTGLMCS